MEKTDLQLKCCRRDSGAVEDVPRGRADVPPGLVQDVHWSLSCFAQQGAPLRRLDGFQERGQLSLHSSHRVLHFLQDTETWRRVRDAFVPSFGPGTTFRREWT